MRSVIKNTHPKEWTARVFDHQGLGKLILQNLGREDTFKSFISVDKNTSQFINAFDNPQN